MKGKNEREILAEAIEVLKQKQALELDLLKQEFRHAYEELKPIHLIQNAFSEATTTPGIKKTIMNDAIGLATGYLSKRFLVGESRNVFRKSVGTFIQFTIAGLVAKHSDEIKSVGEGLIRGVFKSRKKGTRRDE